MEINEKYSVKADGLNVTLYEKSTVQDKDSKNYGKEFEKPIGYFSTPEQAYKFMVNKELAANGLGDIEEVVEKVRVIYDFIKKSMENVAKILAKETDNVFISKEEYKELQEDSEKLSCLETAGVDNWDGYDYAMELMNGEEEENE